MGAIKNGEIKIGKKLEFISKRIMYEQYDQKLTLEKEDHANWENLADLKCPLCGLKLEPIIIAEKDSYFCTCDFQISLDKFNKLTSELQMKRLNARERKMLAENKKIRFKQQKTFRGERPKGIGINF